MEFESHVCTTKEQSEKLFSLGLKKETADCFLEYFGIDNEGKSIYRPTIIVNNCRMPDYEKDLPAWSIGRLWEILPNELELCGELGPNVFQKFIDSKAYIGYIDPNISRLTFKYFWEGDIYDRLITCFQWLAESGYIDSKYIDYGKLFSL